MADKENKKSWTSSTSPLSQALEDWTNISKAVIEEKKIAPDQKMLKDIEGLLVELKSKLMEFDSPVTSPAGPPPADS